ncbi:hypothetical protein J8J40_31310, partial [Mycobacterium tuberculosis]|nr:hypothetical protein [Mycobacterium tuberculosis]
MLIPSEVRAHPPLAIAVAVDAALGRLPTSLVQLALRVAVAVPFWKSGLTKWEAPFRLSENAVLL